MESLYVGDVRRHAHSVLKAERGAVVELSSRLDQIRSNRRYSEETKREQLAAALAEDIPRIRGALEEVREALGRHLQHADGRVSALRQVTPEALSERREALRPFLDRAFDNREMLLQLYRNNFEDPAARRVLEDHVEFFMGSGDPEATALAENWRALKEELSPLRPEAEVRALEERDALSEIAGYVDDGRGLVETALAGLQDGGASAEQMRDLPWQESRVNAFEEKFGLPSSQPGALPPASLQQLLDG